MRGLEWKSILTAAIAGSSLFIAAGAQAHDDDRWRWEHRHHGRGHDRHVHDRTIFVERERTRPVFVERERPVFVAPSPVMMAPMAPYYPPQDPSLNFNFTIPLR
jgi:hypothetical protein